MNQDNESKFAPALPDDDDINTPTNSDTQNSIKIYDGVAECTMNDSDNLKSVKLRAKDLAEENVQKKIAEHIYFFLKDMCLPMPEDETLSIANEISNITDVKYNVFDSDDDKILIRATVTAQIDDNDIMNYVIECFKERTELKSQVEALRKENENLKRQITELTPQIITKDKIALSNQKSYESSKLFSKSDYEGTIKLNNESIELNPNNYVAYFRRGLAYYLLKQYELASKDFDKSIEFDPTNEDWYQIRGFCYYELEQYERVIQNYTEAIKFYPDNAAFYKNRGGAYEKLGDNAKAQADYAKSKELGFND